MEYFEFSIDSDLLYAVYQYTFMDPHTKDTYTVMWDYNVGLVRMTPFFKCCGHPKVSPVTSNVCIDLFAEVGDVLGELATDFKHRQCQLRCSTSILA